MARSRKKPTEETAVETPGAENGDTIFDHGANAQATVTEPQAPAQESNGEEKKRVFQPDPHGIGYIALSDQKDGPSMRLFRSRQDQSMAITFDDKPGPEVIEKLKDDGFRWHPGNKAWMLPMERGSEWRAHADAEKTFKEVGGMIREAAGLEASGQEAAR